MKERREALKMLIDEIGKPYHEGHYFLIVEAISALFPKELVEQLEQFVNGPVWDGDIISKQYRSELFELGLAIRVCCNGEQGFTGAKYLAYSILKRIKD